MTGDTAGGDMAGNDGFMVNEELKMKYALYYNYLERISWSIYRARDNEDNCKLSLFLFECENAMNRFCSVFTLRSNHQTHHSIAITITRKLRFFYCSTSATTSNIPFQLLKFMFQFQV